ncbi:uncharacterized protein LOC144709472 [Wolffia australiana]
MDRPPENPLSRALHAIHQEFIAALSILIDSVRISVKNWHLFLPVIAAVLVPSSLLSLSQILLFLPSFPSSKSRLFLLNAGDDALVVADAALLLARAALDLFQATATAFAACAAEGEPHPSLGNLIRRLRRDWAGPVAALLYAGILRAGYGCGSEVFADALLPVGAGPVGFALWVCWALVGISGGLFFFYLDAAWAAGGAAAVAESCGGLRAVALAAEATARRRRAPGVVLLLGFRACSGAVSWTADWAVGRAAPGPVKVTVWVLAGDLAELLRSLELTALAVFYCRCRRRRPAEDGGPLYSSLASSSPS